MAVVMTPIYTQTVTGTTTNNIVFNNIPQFYTDLKVVISARSLETIAFGYFAFYINSSRTGYSSIRVNGNGASANSDGQSSDTSWYENNIVPGTTSTASVYGSSELYFPNYAGNVYKSFLCQGVSETNATTAYQTTMGGSWSSTAAITQLSFELGNYPYCYAANSTFSLYGIIRYGA